MRKKDLPASLVTAEGDAMPVVPAMPAYTPAPTVTQGRIVIYGDQPAVVQAVHQDGSVRLFVLREADYTVADRVTEGTGAGQWRWPARV